MIKIPFIPLVFLIIIISCSKDDEGNTGTITVNVNGALVHFTGGFAKKTIINNSNYFSLVAFKDPQNSLLEQVSISFSNVVPEANEDYLFGPLEGSFSSSITGAYVKTENNLQKSFQTTGSESFTGKINFSALSSNHVTGTFYFKAVNTVNTSETIDLTEGEFDMDIVQ